MTRDPIALAHAAAAAIETMCSTLDDRAREVDARGNQRTARSRMPDDRMAALLAVRALRSALPSTTRGRQAKYELDEIRAGIIDGYARSRWALRVVTMTTEVTNGG